MGSATVRISATAHNALRAIAAQNGESMQAVLDKAIEDFRRRHLLEQTNAAYAALRNNPQEWTALHEERSIWDVTLADGLPSGDSVSESGALAKADSERA